VMRLPFHIVPGRSSLLQIRQNCTPQGQIVFFLRHKVSSKFLCLFISRLLTSFPLVTVAAFKCSSNTLHRSVVAVTSSQTPPNQASARQTATSHNTATHDPLLPSLSTQLLSTFYPSLLPGQSDPLPFLSGLASTLPQVICPFPNSRFIPAQCCVFFLALRPFLFIVLLHSSSLHCGSPLANCMPQHSL
jgi:hypothetical protein